jgi:hypothetical protein
MEYLNDHGTFADIPVDRILDSWKTVYGSERVRQWIDLFEKSGSKRNRKLENEDWIK